MKWREILRDFATVIVYEHVKQQQTMQTAQYKLFQQTQMSMKLNESLLI